MEVPSAGVMDEAEVVEQEEDQENREKMDGSQEMMSIMSAR